MAGDWIKVKTDLATDPAVITLAAALDMEEDLVVGKLCRLWSWANTHTGNGHADGVTAEWLDRFLELDGFARVLADVGWLEITDDGLEIPRFDRHNGKSAKTRATARERKRRERQKSGADAQKSASPATQRNGHADSVTRTGHVSAREENRREKPPPLNPPIGCVDVDGPGTPELSACGWDEVERALGEEGVFASAPAVMAARESGASVQDVVDVINHARLQSGAWGPGAIRNRVMATRPGLDPGEGWPSPSEDFERARQADLEGTARRKRQKELEIEEAKNAESKQADDEREDIFGTVLDDMPKPDRDKLARELLGSGPVLTSYRQRGAVGMARQMLLAELEERYQEAEAASG